MNTFNDPAASAAPTWVFEHPDFSASADVLARGWLHDFEASIRQPERLNALLDADPHWRDLLAFTWSIRSFSGSEAVLAAFEAGVGRVHPRAFRIAQGRTPPRFVMRAGRTVLECMFDFETDQGQASGVLRAIPGDEHSPVRAWVLLTTLKSLRGGLRTSEQDVGSSREFGTENWLDRRLKAGRYEDRDPAVLVLGAGQAGLSVAARLVAAGIDTLVIDRQARLGDNWRKRYHSLALHNEVHVNHMPYMPFPQTWPTFIPKDKLANWFEAYAEALELNCWMSTTLSRGHWDEGARCWDLTLTQADGRQRRMRPRHVVFACGVSAIPKRPDLPGLQTFAGTVMHSGDYTEGSAWTGQPVVVLGTGNSAHDVAQDLHARGARVTLVQRSPTHIVSLREAQRVYSIYKEGMPTDDCDLLATAIPPAVLKKAYQVTTAISQEIDRPLLEALAARGFRLTPGDEGTGFQMMYLKRGGGYYFNIGCSELIASGQIDLLPFDQIERIEPQGLRLKDGALRPAQLIVAATGYHGAQEVVRRSLGDEIADRIGPVWGLDEDGEVRNMWRPTAQPGLWFNAGSLAQCRIYSKVIALQIEARERGLLPFPPFPPFLP
jgi:cation diffusion facilitator CzcD-associated flavoprotein CzcO